MKILHTEWMRREGGQTKRVLADLRIIRKLGHTPILACKKESWLYEASRKEGFETHAVPFGHLANPESYFAIYHLIKKTGADIVHTHSSKDSYPATLAAKILGKKVVRSRHIELKKRPGLLFHLADAIVTTGELVRKEFLDAGFTPQKVVSIPSYPNASRFSPDQARRERMRREYEATDDGVIIGTMAGAGLRKRSYALVEMMPRLLQKQPKTKLLIAGDARGNDLQRLEEIIEQLGIGDSVRFVGYAEPEAFLDAIDIYACPSKSEGLPQALMQAMMMGKACVSTDVGSIRELNVENNLLLCDADDLAAFETHLKMLLDDEGYRKKVGAANRELCLQRFNEEVMVRKTGELYASLERK